jgi:hypothetical protein
MMKPGELVEFAIWLSGEETEDQLNNFRTSVVPHMIKQTEEQYDIKLGKPVFTVKRPGEDRVPKVPPHIKGIDVRLMLVEAITYEREETAPKGKVLRDGSFLADLTEDDLKKLRTITNRAYFKQHGLRLNDKQCDMVIDYLGPDAAVAALRETTQ